MGRKYYDDFTRFPVEKMAKEMSDMTYSYEFAVVPKEHYKKLLTEELAELLSSEPSIELNLLQPYLDIISNLAKENAKFFFKALLLFDNKVTLSSISAPEIEALDICWKEHSEDKKKKCIMRDEIRDTFKKVSRGGRNVYIYVDDCSDDCNGYTNRNY